ncbi:MAG: hypothetical protein GY796_27390 [Chloroflexi bacterium]|nr:hypothetical protein [Chloroflexota bacterium]
MSTHGVSLHTELALTKNLNPVRGALFGIVGGEFPTFVWKSEDRTVAGFIQVCLNDEAPLAHILYLSSTSNTAVTDDVPPTAVSPANGQLPDMLNEQAWLTLLDKAVVEVGRRGFHSLVAEVSEIGPELPILRRAGFVVYTRQDVWMLNEVINDIQADILRPRQEVDDWDIQLLYANTVPRLVQMVEPMPPLDESAGWVLREDGELAAFIHIHTGSAATWMRLFVHPNAEARVDEILTAVVQLSPLTLTHPIYCCVRRYQSWVQGALERAGFTLWGSQAVMVKHTVQQQTRKPIPDLSALLDAQPISPTTPIVHSYGDDWRVRRVNRD